MHDKALTRMKGAPHDGARCAPYGRWPLAWLLMAVLSGCAPEPPPRPPVKLSAGVALAQTGPEGTLMMFSVDYRFLDEKVDPAARYLWIIQPASGEPLEQEVRLRKKQDTLQAIVPQWRPENGPFKTQLFALGEDGARRELSATHAMR